MSSSFPSVIEMSNAKQPLALRAVSSKLTAKIRREYSVKCDAANGKKGLAQLLDGEIVT